MSPLQEIKDFVGFVHYKILEDNVVEDGRPTGRMRVRGIFQRADTKNANGRIYSASLWERVLSDNRTTDMLQRKRMMGEVEHPERGVTNLNRVSHVVTRLDREGNDIIGEAEVLNTPSGQIIQELFRAGCEVGISSRGRGTSQTRGGVEYVDETSYQLDTFDFVYKPSTPDAYPKLQEGVLKGPYGRNSTMKEKQDELKRLEVAALDLAKGVDQLGADDLRKRFQSCVEAESSADTLVGLLSEEERGALQEQVAGTTSRILEARTALVTALDAHHVQNDADLDRRVDNALEDATPGDEKEEEKKGAGAPATESSRHDAAIERFKTLLRETREARDHYRERLAEALEVLESDEDELRRRYVAAKGLGNELLTRLRKSEGALDDLSQAHHALEERYGAAVRLVSAITERQDRARLTRSVREAIEATPDLARFSKSLLSCASEAELGERIEEYKKALGLPTQDKHEALTRQVNLSAAVDDEPGDHGDRSELPKRGDAINEGADSEVLSTVVESTDPGVRAARAAIGARPGWI